MKLKLNKFMRRVTLNAIMLLLLAGAFSITDISLFDSVNDNLGNKGIIVSAQTPFRLLRIEDSHEDVIELKYLLTWLGYGNITINKNFDSFTEARVREFQSDHGLVIDGIVGQATWNKLSETLKTVFQEGQRHRSVIELKEKLITIGYGDMNVNDTYGSLTSTRVSQFQSEYNLPPTGVANRTTLAKLDQVVSDGLYEGQVDSTVVDFKKKLTRAGYGNMNINTTYGSLTADLVKQFQSDYGLRPNGVANDVTLEKLDEILNTVFREDDRHHGVLGLKDKLITIGYGGMNVNDTYGSFTAIRVSEFQTDYNLPSTGEADQATLAKLDQVVSDGLYEGKVASAVVGFKQKLTRAGYGNMNINTTYGSLTADLVKQFQSDYGLRPNGVANDVTLEKLDEILSSPFQDGKRHEDVNELKYLLTWLGYGDMNINDTYGSFTKIRVKEFQRDHGLIADGVVNQITWNKLEETLNTVFKEGKRHRGVLELKRKLITIGYGDMNINDTYGSLTATRVSEFQSDYNLPSTGVANRATLSKIDQVVSTGLYEGQVASSVVEFKKKLTHAGYGNMNINTTYGSLTSSLVRQFQLDYGLRPVGTANEVTIEKLDVVLTIADQSIKYTKYNITLEEAVNLQMRVKPQTDMNYAYVSIDYIDSDNKVSVNTNLNVRNGPSTSQTDVIGSLPNGTRVNILGEANGFYQIEFPTSGWGDAARSDVAYYLNPNNFELDERQRFQYLDLSRSSGADKSLLDAYLKGKGILDGHGQSFIDASEAHGVNDVYLISHALLETGHGRSDLSKGVEVGKDKSSNLVLVDDKNRSNLTDIKTAYNMYGIGAVDNNAHEGGAFRAYNSGWFTPRDAIIGGAQFIGTNYMKAGQNTLYKMRWNPGAMVASGRATHQYATDIGWASKQVTNMYNMYRDIGITIVNLDIPKYSN